MSDAEEPPLAKVHEEHLPAAGRAGNRSAGLSGGVDHAGRETARQLGFLPDRPRREGNLSSALQLRWQASEGQAFDRWWTEVQSSDNWWPVLQFQTSTTSEDRLTVLEGMMMDVRNDLQARCVTAWGTQCMDNLKVEGPLALRGARTPERQPTEPTPCEIEATEPSPCEIEGAHACF